MRIPPEMCNNSASFHNHIVATNRSGLILSLARSLGIRDPRAVLSVAAQEGLGGGIGDRGTSFGPFQLHVGGAFPAGIQGNRHQWAWSRPGLLYALNRIKAVAGNRQGADAIANIVNRFERPANAQGEIAKALAYYRGGSSAGSGISTSPAPADGNDNKALLMAIINNQSLIPAITQMQASSGPQETFSPQAAPQIQGSVPAELFYRNQALKFGKHIGAVKGHYDHVHVAETNPQAMLAAIALAHRLGLRVGENPYEGGVDPVHVKNSYHYRSFKEKYHGKRLGEAIDVSGSPKLMGQYYRLLAGGR